MHPLPVLLLAALCGCGIIERPDTDLSSGDYTAYAGAETYTFASGPGAVNCELYWSAAGSPAATSCPTCVFAFDVAFTFDGDRSIDDGTCGTQQLDFSATYVLLDEADGYRLGTWTNGAITIFAEATFDASGQLSYTGLTDAYAYGYGYYYTQLTAGYASVQ
ncbi:MAG: hypothetical protein ACI8S6_001941 [Myxococcota bacterium]|jgi:hypothetical protein